jgi:hypothetical protein
MGAIAHERVIVAVAHRADPTGVEYPRAGSRDDGHTAAGKLADYIEVRGYQSREVGVPTSRDTVCVDPGRRTDPRAALPGLSAWRRVWVSMQESVALAAQSRSVTQKVDSGRAAQAALSE